MRHPRTRRQYRGLLLHTVRHRASHSRRLVNRTARWGEPPINGVCRWRYERTASLKTRWHSYCLDAYRVASGQKPEEMQLTLCEICGGRADEIDHRLAITVAKALGKEAELRAFNARQSQMAVPAMPPAQDGQDRIIARAASARELDWRAGQSHLIRQGF